MTAPAATGSVAAGEASRPFNLLCIAQAGRLAFEALLLVASLRRSDPGFGGRIFVAHPVAGPLWRRDPAPGDPRWQTLLEGLGAELLPFESRVFGDAYPHGNKIEALLALPEGQPFLFLDSDTLVTGALSRLPFDFAQPAASMRREGSWPQIPLYGPGHAQIWGALYRRFGLEMAPSLDLRFAEDDWRRYLYFNAGWFFHEDPVAFGTRFRAWAEAIRTDPPEELASQSLDPWLDQVTLPLVIHSFGGGRPGPGLSGLDGAVTCHYRTLPLLYARESDAAVALLEELAHEKPLRRVLREHEPLREMVYRRRGAKVRALFDRSALPASERALRNRIRKAGLWLR